MRGKGRGEFCLIRDKKGLNRHKAERENLDVGIQVLTERSRKSCFITRQIMFKNMINESNIN